MQLNTYNIFQFWNEWNKGSVRIELLGSNEYLSCKSESELYHVLDWMFSRFNKVQDGTRKKSWTANFTLKLALILILLSNALEI